MYRIVCTSDVAKDTTRDHRRAVMASGFCDLSGAMATAANWVERHHPGAIYETGVWHISPLNLVVAVEKDHPLRPGATIPAMA